MAFTLSQSGMVMHWKRQGNAPVRLGVNLLGAVATGITTLVVLVAKFAEGAWITALLVIIMIIVMRTVKKHYEHVAREIDLDRPMIPVDLMEPVVVMPVDRWSRISEKALSFGLSISTDVRCVHVQIGDDADPFCVEWDEMIIKPLEACGRCSPKLVTLKSPFRYILQPVVDYVLKVERETGNRNVCVLVPELVVHHWWEGLLHNRRADLLKVILLVRGNRRIVVINIPWYLDAEGTPADPKR
jgi:hypothetical protein